MAWNDRQLVELLFPWDENGVQLKGKSVNAYYWASEMRRETFSPCARRISRRD